MLVAIHWRRADRQRHCHRFALKRSARCVDTNRKRNYNYSQYSRHQHRRRRASHSSLIITTVSTTVSANYTSLFPSLLFALLSIIHRRSITIDPQRQNRTKPCPNGQSTLDCSQSSRYYTFYFLFTNFSNNSFPFLDSLVPIHIHHQVYIYILTDK